MYYIIGADGNEYGPVNEEQLRTWISQGRVNAQTRVRVDSSGAWMAASQIPELSSFWPAQPTQAATPPPISTAQSASGGQGQNTGLALASLILGILGVFCFGPLTGIPAIITGHMANSRVQRSPAVYGGKTMAVVGLVLGYVSLLWVFLLAAMLLPALAKAKNRAQEVQCTNNMKQIGLGFKIWAMDHNEAFPFNVSTNNGGTLELASRGPEGADPNGYLHLTVLSNELYTPKILVCPGDKKQPAATFANLRPANVSYRIMSGPDVSDTNGTAVMAMCPIHGHVLTADGAVENFGRKRRHR